MDGFLRDAVEEREEDGVELDVVLRDGVGEGVDVVAVLREVVHEGGETHARAANIIELNGQIRFHLSEPVPGGEQISFVWELLPDVWVIWAEIFRGGSENVWLKKPEK